MPLHFRSLPNGYYSAFRVVQGEKARPEFVKIGAGNVEKESFTPDEGVECSDAELEDVARFVAKQRRLAARERQVETERLPLKLRMATRWIPEATEAELEDLGDQLLFSMYDLREAILARKVQLAKARKAEAAETA